MKRDRAAVLVLVILGAIGQVAWAQPRQWTFLAPMPTPRAGAAVAVLNGFIYVVGGEDQDGEALSVVERYDPQNNVWDRSVPSLKKARANAAAVVYRGHLFVVGGRRKNEKAMADVEMFDLARGRWVNFDRLLQRREGLGAVALDDELYAFGGSDKDEMVVNSVEVWDADRGKWKPEPLWTLAQSRASFATAVWEDTVFSVGGYGAFTGPLSQVEQYAPGSGTTVRTMLPTPRGGLAAAVIKGMLYVVGGRNAANEVSDGLEVFNLRTNEWEEAQRLNQARENLAGVALGETLYVIGGRDSRGTVLQSIESFDATGVGVERPDLPADFALNSGRPNPFSTRTDISFQVSAEAPSVTVQLTIYDLQGRLVKRLVEAPMGPGLYEVTWAGVGEDGRLLSSGIYFCRLQQGRYLTTQKVVLIR